MEPRTPPRPPHSAEGPQWDPFENPWMQVEKDRIVAECEAEAAAARGRAMKRPPFALREPSEPGPAQPDGEQAESELDDRWSKPKMADFLRALAAQQSVSAAARSVGMSRQSAYKLRNRLKGEPFDIAWEAAFQHGYDALHQAALERALHGVEVPVFHKGEQIATRRHYDERLTTFLLGRRNAVGAQRVGRYGAAAEFWSERWERMLEQVETGPVVWLDEDGRRMALDDAKLTDKILIRHALDNAEDRSRFGNRR